MICGAGLIIVWANLIMIASTDEADFDEIDATDFDEIENHTSAVAAPKSASPAVKRTYLTQITHKNRGAFVFEHNVYRSSTDPIASDMVYMVNLRLSLKFLS